jgi:large subunit ribosomal protein L1
MAEAKKTAKKAAVAKVTKKKEVKEAEIIVEALPVDAKTEIKVEKVTTTKAGKHSPKATREAEALEEKEAKKAAEPKAEDKPKETKQATRPKAERSGKKYREVFKLVEKDKVYSLGEGLELVLKTATTKFDSTVELHINLGVDPRQADQNIRDTVILPGGTGKTVRIAVLADEDQAKTALAAGADVAGSDAVLAKLDKEDIDFDVLIATPAQMPKLGKYARLLGPRGLMPNPKSGTVTNDIDKAVAEAKAGKVEYRVDQAGIVHLAIGKVSFGTDKMRQNADAVIASIKAAKPSSTKGNYIKTAYLTTTMGPSVKIDLN